MKKISILLLAIGSIASWPAIAAEPDFSHIETSGYGEIIAKPDMAEFTVQVVESALSAEQAKKTVDDAVSSFSKRLLDSGVERDSIKSTNLSLYPQYHYPKSGQSELVGYKASRQITVTIYDLENLNKYLDGALGDGINRVDSVQLKVRDREKFQQQARLKAIEDATQKANFLAEGFNGRLDGVWKISYQNRNIQPVMRGMAMDAKANSSAGYQDTRIMINDSVDVIYRFEQN